MGETTRGRTLRSLELEEGFYGLMIQEVEFGELGIRGSSESETSNCSPQRIWISSISSRQDGERPSVPSRSFSLLKTSRTARPSRPEAPVELERRRRERRKSGPLASFGKFQAGSPLVYFPVMIPFILQVQRGCFG